MVIASPSDFPKGYSFSWRDDNTGNTIQRLSADTGTSWRLRLARRSGLHHIISLMVAAVRAVNMRWRKDGITLDAANKLMDEIDQAEYPI
jgi:hypothetical protein